MTHWETAAEAYWWVYHHPKLQCHGRGPWIELVPHMVDRTGEINDDRSQNTYMAWWVEFGPYEICDDELAPNRGEIVGTHDWECDCGAPTADRAVKNLAELVLAKYGPHTD